MLTDIKLDNESFEDLMEEAKNLIISEFPEWTDFNYHDPGITICEMFAFLKEVAQYRMNYIGEEHYLRYLRLIGIKREPVRPARALVALSCQKTQKIPVLTRFYASDICFESTSPQYLIAGDLCGCIYESQGERIFLDRQMLGFARILKIPVFGKQPKRGNCFYMAFDEALPKDTVLSIYANVYSQYDIARNPVSETFEFKPLATVAMEYYTSQGWRLCESFCDRTWGFLQNGWIEFQISEEMVKTSEAGHSGFFLRLRLLNERYDIPPLVTKIGMNFVEAVQTRHYAVCQDYQCEEHNGKAICYIEANEVNMQNLAILLKKGIGYQIFENFTLQLEEGRLKAVLECDEEGSLPDKIRVLSWENDFDANQIVGVGDGLPFQEFALENRKLDSENFRLMVQDFEDKNILCEWEQVPDFSCSGVEDRHYVLDNTNHKIIFGDCIHGIAPEGKILIVQYVTTEGQDGNVKAGKIDIIGENNEFLTVSNENNAFGGRDKELLEDCFIRAKKSIYDNAALVTDEDYENAVRRTPGLMIENCRVLHQDMSAVGSTEEVLRNRITIVVKPYSFEKSPQLSSEYIHNILVWLDPLRMAGTEICLISPKYIKIHVFAECKGRNNYIFDRKEIIDALNRHFQPYGAKFGGIISYSEVYELLDRLDAVEEMEALSIDVTGSKVRRTFGGDIILPPNGLISIENIEYNININ